MIKSQVFLNNKQQPIKTQRIIILCDSCGNEWDSYYYNYLKGLENYNKDLCRSCKQKYQIKIGIRSKDQYIKAGNGYKNKYEGKKIEDIIGKERGIKKRKDKSEQMKGSKNPMYGKNYQTYGIRKWVNEIQKGNSYETIYGQEKSNNIKENLSNHFKGKKNPMYGKPSPIGSGNGWSGWYKGWYFRSLTELSFMINVIERFNFKWKSAENKKYKIKYLDYDSKERNYYPDFILNDKYLVEIKPKSLHTSDKNIRKKEAAIIFCNQNNLKYKLLDSIKKLTFLEIDKLLSNNDIKFIERYNEKFISLKLKKI